MAKLLAVIFIFLAALIIFGFLTGHSVLVGVGFSGLTVFVALSGQVS